MRQLRCTICYLRWLNLVVKTCRHSICDVCYSKGTSSCMICRNKVTGNFPLRFHSGEDWFSMTFRPKRLVGLFFKLTYLSPSQFLGISSNTSLSDDGLIKIKGTKSWFPGQLWCLANQASFIFHDMCLLWLLLSLLQRWYLAIVFITAYMIEDIDIPTVSQDQRGMNIV